MSAPTPPSGTTLPAGTTPQAAGPDAATGPDGTPALLRRRRRLLLASAPVVAVVVLLSIKLLSLPLLAGPAADAFARGDGATTQQMAKGLKVANLVERFKAPFAAGDALVLTGDLPGARREFESALALAGPAADCMVRVNLVLTIEKLGDAKAAEGDAAGAKTLYEEGLAQVKAAPEGCFQPNSEANSHGEGGQLQEAGDRLSQKSDGAEGGTPEAGQNPQPAESTPAPEVQSKLDQLQEQQKGAQKERSDGATMDKNLDQEPGNYQEKRW
ncbi:hypothetical protein [Arthrobacter sp. 35W]|uniref:hypothetical protein n=1 Tax=Arthrobacter sp. 35W TaxID=1132441 RepID=UPI0003F64824|nr:hypothetical protein [Arthrobacter sp. 35W]